MKKNRKKVFIFFVSLLMFISCNNLIEHSIQSNDNESINEEIVLGLKRTNPFAINSSRMLNTNVEANYVYFRIRTNKVENVEEIENILGELTTVPLDYEIKEGGCFFSENIGSEEFTPWFYAITPIEQFSNVKLFGEIEILEEMLITDEELALFSDVEEMDNSETRILWVNYTKKRPTGYVYFYDEVKKQNIPLKGVKVTVSQWCHVKSVYTNEDGYYDIGEYFTSCWQDTANIKITFETAKDCVYPEWSLLKASYNAGDKKVSVLSGNNIYLARETTQNNYGILLNAATKYREYASLDKVTLPTALKFWACKGINGGITLMRDVVIADSATIGAAIGTGIVPGAGSIIGTITGAVIGAYFPDIMISVNTVEGITMTELITETVFHEMAHASHYTAIGFGQITYWNEEYIKMLGGWIEVLCNGELPSNNCYNNGKSKQVCFIESWGYFYGFMLTKRHFNDYVTIVNYDLSLAQEEDSLSFLYYSTYYSIKDTISISQIFTPYKYFGVQSIDLWYAKLKSLNNTFDLDEKIKKEFSNRGISL